MAQIPDWSWAKNPSGNNEDYALAVTADASGNSYAAGYFASTTLTFGSTILTKTGGADIFIVKYAVNGNVLWAKNAGGDGTEKAYAVAADGSGNVYVAGFFNSSSITFGATTLTNTGGDDVFIAKYDGSNGNVLWAKNGSGSGNDQARSLTTDGSGNVYVAGYFYSASIIFSPNILNNSNLNGSSADLFIVKYNSAGTVQWSQKAGGNVEDDFAYSVTNASGNIYLAGPFASSSITFGTTTLTNTSSSGSNDFYIVKYNGSGNVLWAKKAGGTGQDWLQSVTADNSGNAILTGYFLSSSITIGSTTLNNEGDGDVFIAKYDGSTGNVVWATGAAGNSTDQAYSVTADASGNCYVAGYFSSPSILFGSTTLTNNSAGSYDIFLAKYDGSGNSVWAQRIGESSHDQAYSVFSDALGNIYLAGGFGSSSLTFGSHTITNSAIGDFDAFVAQIGVTGCTVTISPTSATICKKQAVSLTATSSSGTGTWTWAPSKGLNVTTGSTVSAKPNSTKTYTATNSGGCSATVTVTVNPQPSTNITQGTCSGGHILLNSNANPNTGVKYKWLLNGTMISGATNATYSAGTSGSYKVKVTIIATGCVKTSAAVTVTITCKASDVSVGAFDVTAYPNPFDKSVSVNIATGSGESATVTLLDLSGRILREYNNIDVSKPFEINENLGAGVYFVNVKQGSNDKMVKVVKND